MTLAVDVLNQIHVGAIDEINADLLLDRILDSESAPDVKKLLRLTPEEWTAKGQGVLWSVLARWRYAGWPSRCAVCNRSIDPHAFGWRVIVSGETQTIKHIKCPMAED